MLDYNSIAELIQTAEKENITISELVVRDQAEQAETPREKLIAHMRDNLHVMQKAVAEGTAQDLKSTSGLTGGDAYKMQQYSTTGGLCGSFFGNALTRALAVSEYNAAMGKIVAAPTAGSCGILPGTILSLLEERDFRRYRSDGTVYSRCIWHGNCNQRLNRRRTRRLSGRMWECLCNGSGGFS